jgi:hypothetical protein
MEEPMHKRTLIGVVLLGLIVFLTSLCYTNTVVAQEKKDDSPCPTPYIKIIKPKLAQHGQEIIIRAAGLVLKTSKEMSFSLRVYPGGSFTGETTGLGWKFHGELKPVKSW